MNILMDTHVIVWALTDDKRLTQKAREILCSSDNTLYYSAVSVAEIDMKSKSKSNNLSFSVDVFMDLCHEAGYVPLPLKEDYIRKSNQLIWEGDEDVHKDPFDRVLLAQAMCEDMFFMTHDSKIPKFKQDCVITF